MTDHPSIHPSIRPSVRPFIIHACIHVSVLQSSKICVSCLCVGVCVCLSQYIYLPTATRMLTPLHEQVENHVHQDVKKFRSIVWCRVRALATKDIKTQTARKVRKGHGNVAMQYCTERWLYRCQSGEGQSARRGSSSGSQDLKGFGSLL